MQVQSLGREDLLEEEMATHASILAWKIPWTWVGKIPWRRKWQPTPVFLPGDFHGQRNLVGHWSGLPVPSPVHESEK